MASTSPSHPAVPTPSEKTARPGARRRRAKRRGGEAADGDATPARPGGGPQLGRALERASGLGTGSELSAETQALRERLVELERIREETERLRSELARRQSASEQLERDRAHEAEQVVKRDAMIAELRELISQTTADVSAIHTEQAALRDALVAAQQTIASQEGGIERLRQAVDGNERTSGAREAELVALRHALDEREREAEDRERCIAQLRASLAARERELHDHHAEAEGLGEALAKRERSTTELERELCGLRQALVQSAEEGRRLEAESEQQQRAAREAAAALAGREQENADLRRALSGHDAHALERDTEIAQLRQALANREDRAALQETEIEALRETLASRERELRLREERLEGLRDSEQAARRDADAEREQARRYREGLAAAERTLAERVRENSALQSRLAGAEQESGEREVALEELRRSCARQDAELRRLEQAIGEREAAARQLEQRLAEREVAVGELEQALDEAQSRVRLLFCDPEPDAEEPEAEVPETEGALATAEEEAPEPEPEARAAQGVPIPEATAARADLAEAAEPREADGDRDAAEGAEAQRPAAEASAPARGWRLLPWRRGRDAASPPETRPPAQLEPPARSETQRAALAVAPKPAPAEGPPVAEPAELPAIHHYWRRSQILSKLQMRGIESTDDFFLHYIVEMCRADPGRTHRIVSVGTGSRDLDVVLARRALDAGVRNFQLHSLAPVPSSVSCERAIAAESSILGHLTLVQCGAETWSPEPPYDLCIANQSLHQLGKPEAWIEKIAQAIHPDGALLASTPIGRLDRPESPVAHEIVSQIWQLMPERYKGRGELPAAGSVAGGPEDPHPTAGAGEILPLLAKDFHFEVFIAFGNLINAFVDGAVGAHFDPESERDRRFIDQVAALDDAKIDAGLIPPTHLLAALRTTRVDEPVVYKGWTPEFFLGRR